MRSILFVICSVVGVYSFAAVGPVLSYDSWRGKITEDNWSTESSSGSTISIGALFEKRLPGDLGARGTMQFRDLSLSFSDVVASVPMGLYIDNSYFSWGGGVSYFGFSQTVPFVADLLINHLSRQQERAQVNTLYTDVDTSKDIFVSLLLGADVRFLGIVIGPRVEFALGEIAEDVKLSPSFHFTIGYLF